MKIRISEVWNYKSESIELAIIESHSNNPTAVWEWIRNNRPDLELATASDAHGFHAIAIN